MGGEQHLEVVGGEGDDVEEEGGHVHCQQVAQDSPSQGDLHNYKVIVGVHGRVLDIVLGRVDCAMVDHILWSQHHKY